MGKEKDATMIEFNIEKYCRNAGRINKLAKSAYSYEEETLIPPYSVCIVKSKEKGKVVLDLAQDNNDNDFLVKAQF